MKTLSLVVIYTFLCSAVFAQTTMPLEPAYKRIPTIPPYNLISVADSIAFTKDNLKKKKSTVIIIFSPTCENCVEETKELKQKISLFKKAQIVMVSPLDFSYLRTFYNDNNIAQYPTIIMGRDPGYFLGTFYKVRSLPSIFVYNKKGNLVKSFIGSTPVEEIAAAL